MNPERESPPAVLQPAGVKYFMREGEVTSERFGKCFPIIEQKVFAEEMLTLLTMQDTHGGSWDCVWSNPKKHFFDKLSGLIRTNVPQLFEVIWRDQDGDMQFLVENPDDVHLMLEKGISYYAEGCHEAYYQWKRVYGALELKQNQVFRRMMGEQRQSAKPFRPFPPSWSSL